MLNDRSSLLSLLRTRRSGKPRQMAGARPSSEELDQMLTIAARTPDHGKLTPWRFLVVEDRQRDAFADMLRAALAEEEAEAGPARHHMEEEFAHYQGALVVLLSAPVPGHKVPVWEQELSCGAAGMNLLIAAHALGYVGGWLTGWRAYSPLVAASICRPGERIAGFIFIGEPGSELEERARPALSDVTRRWSPQA